MQKMKNEPFVVGCARARYQETKEAQLSQGDRATLRFVPLNILLSHSRSLEMTMLSRACVYS